MKWVILIFMIPVFSMPVHTQEFVQVKPLVLPVLPELPVIIITPPPTVWFELLPEGGLRTIIVSPPLIVPLEPRPRAPRRPLKLEPGWAIRN